MDALLMQKMECQVKNREMEELSMKKRVYMKKRVSLLVMLLALVIMGSTMSVEAAEIIDRGYCGGEGDGKNLTWTLDSDGVLVIEGQGKMKDWTGEESDPYYSDSKSTDWHIYKEDINSVIIQNGVMSIGYGAFEGCSGLSAITLPNALTYIGKYSFLGCSNLINIALPDALASIGGSAFQGCSSLSSIDFPDSLANIEERAFSYCINLGRIELPQSLTSIERGTFEGCSNLNNVVLPESLTTIWEFAFASCDKLSNIYIPSSIMSIDQAAFVDTHLKDIFFGGTKAQWNNINIMPTDDLDIIDELSGIYTTDQIYNGLTNATIHYVDDDYEKLNDLTSRLYRNFLRREPDEKGLAAWVDALVSGIGTGAKVVSGFVLSPEYKANSLSNEEYITALYRIIFNREPDAAGLNAWIGVIDNGCTHKKVLAGFANSEEFNNLCRGLGIARGAYYSDEVADQNVKIAAFVARLYKICLGRSYDQDGLNNWVSALASHTMTGSSVVQGFFGSQEFKNRNLDDTLFVTTAYRSILNREPDPIGLESWIDALAKGKTRSNVLNGFLKSTEFDNLCAEYRIISGNARKIWEIDYILPNGDLMYDLDVLSDKELRLARNEIYARRGYVFSDAEMVDYFAKKAWYKPLVSSKDFDEQIFNKNERSCIEALLSEEAKRANERASLSADEMLKTEIERFLNSHPIKGFLMSTFTEPGYDVDLWNIVGMLYREIGVDYNTFRKEYKKEGYIPITWCDIFYTNSDMLDEILYRLTGYGLYEKNWNLNSLGYLKSIDTYYVEHSGIFPSQLMVKKIKSLGNDVYEVFGNRLTVKLKRIENGGYQVISVLGSYEPDDV